MNSWTIKIGTHENNDYFEVNGVKGWAAFDALRKEFPDFKWVTGIRLMHRPYLTFVYSGMEGWAEVSQEPFEI